MGPSLSISTQVEAWVQPGRHGNSLVVCILCDKYQPLQQDKNKRMVFTSNKLFTIYS